METLCPVRRSKEVRRSLGKHQLSVLKRLQALAEPDLRSPEIGSSAGKILEVLHDSVGFDAAWVLRSDLSSSQIVDIHLHRFCQHSFSRYLNEFYSRTPLPTAEQIVGRAFGSKRGSDLVDEMEWKQSAFYREVLEPLGLHFFLAGAGIDRRSGATVLIVLWRSRHRSDFSTRDRLLLEEASSASATVLCRRACFRSPSENAEMLDWVAHRSRPGILVLGEENKILLSNQEGKEFLTMVSSGREYLASPERDLFFRKLKRVRSSAVRESTVSEQNSGRNASFEVFPFRGTVFSLRGIPMDLRKSKEKVMVLIEAVKEASGFWPSASGPLPQFTARETAVAKWMGQGLTNKEIAAQMEIGIYTVKDHIKNIMRKLNTNTRSGVVAKTMAISSPNLLEGE